jgi:hypothetical protein
VSDLGSIQDQSLVAGLGPLTKTLFDKLNKGVHVITREGKGWEVHGLPFVLGFQATTLPQHETI